MSEAKAFSITVAVVYSKGGGMVSTSYDKETTIQRAKADLEQRLREGIPDGMLCSLVTGDVTADIH